MTSEFVGSTVVVDNDKPVDREKTCPLLLRVFCNSIRHNSIQEYGRGIVPSNELQMYTWMDATLSELAGLVKEVNPDTRRKGTYFDFAVVSTAPATPGYRMKEVGTVVTGQRGTDDNKSLQQMRFVIGDYLDIAISSPMMHRGNMRGMPLDRFQSYRDDRMDRMDRMGPPMRRMRPY